jgi:hypothetical protein
MKAPTAIAYVSPSTATTTQSRYELCESKANAKMATMRFSSSQATLDYKTNLINICMGVTEQPSTNTITPKPTTTTTTTPTPVVTGTSAIVEPDFTNVKVYDLDTPSGGGAPTNLGGSKGEVSEGNGENTSNTTITAKKPNYVLYGGIAISAILLYKILK